MCRPTHGFAPCSSRAVFVMEQQPGTKMFASVANDGDEYVEADDLDEAWLRFQEERSSSSANAAAAKQFSLPPRDNLFDPQEEVDTQQQLALTISLLVAVGCLVAIYFSGEAPHIVVDDPASFLSNNLEDIDSAQGRYHALTGGYWL